MNSGRYSHDQIVITVITVPATIATTESNTMLETRQTVAEIATSADTDPAMPIHVAQTRCFFERRCTPVRGARTR